MRLGRTILNALALAGGDALCVLVAFIASAAVMKGAWSIESLRVAIVEERVYLVAFMVSWIVIALGHRLYVPRRSDDLLPKLFTLTISSLSASVLAVFLLVMVERGRVDRGLILATGTGMFVLLLYFRLACRLWLWRLHFRGYDTNNIVLVGANETTLHAVEAIMAHEQYGYAIRGVIDDSPERARILQPYDVRYLGKLDDLEEILVRKVVDGVYICLPVRSFYSTVLRVAHLCEGIGVPVRLVAERLPLGAVTNPMWRLDDIPFMTIASDEAIPTRLLTRRAIDWTVALLLLLALSPLLALIGILIKVESGRSPIATEPAKNWHGRVYQAFRFRVTRPDGQVSRLGSILRRYKLDELPNLVNVCLGHKSIAGHVPPPPAEVAAAMSDSRTDRKDSVGAVE